MINLPPEYLSRMKQILGVYCDEYIKSLDEKPIRAFRVNTQNISTKQFEKINDIDSQKIPYVENGYYFTSEKIGAHPFHHCGMIYAQEPGAMSPLECFDIENGLTCLDMCASPGGKSTQIKNKIGDNGVLVSNEIIPSRCKILTGNIERMGFKNTIVTCSDTKRISKSYPKAFDIVVVDAPCSGEGMFRKDEEAIKQWSIENVYLCAERQKEILEDAYFSVADGGVIVYSTCTFSLEENEKVIDNFIENHPEFEIMPVKKEVKDATLDGIFFDGCKVKNINECRRFYPFFSKGEGQFMCILKSTLPYFKNVKFDKNVLCKTNNKVIFDFLDDTLISYNKNEIWLYKNNPVIFSNSLPLTDNFAFSCGVTVGELRNNYILPHHQFFSAFGNSFKRRINLDYNSTQAEKYLLGETFETDCENGWAVVCFNEVSVGGVKVVNGVAKNHYPKGLRNRK